MEGGLASTLDSTPLRILHPDHGFYSNSLLHLTDYLRSVAEAAALSTKVHVAGFDVDQIWEQTQSILAQSSASARPTRFTHARISGKPFVKVKGPRGSQAELLRSKHRSERPDASEEQDTAPELLESPASLEDIEPMLSADESSESGDEASVPSGHTRPRTWSPKTSLRNGVDDGFFVLERFNLETQRFEEADELGLPLDLAIDWNADPGEEMEPELEDTQDATADPVTGREIMYSNFFAAPTDPPDTLRQKPGQETDVRPRKDRPAVDSATYEDEFANMIKSMQDDMFKMAPLDEEEDDHHESDSDSWDQPDDLNSSHRKLQARLNDEIRKLEKQNTGSRGWALSGETDSQHRPFNSLLEEDFDFERIGKPVPVVTQDTTAHLEDMIKGRILAGNFDEIPRRSPNNTGNSRQGITLRSGIDDSKSKVGLAEIYERETAEPHGNSTDNSEARWATLRNEIAGLFSRVNNDLDMLSSWHFTPKTPVPSLSIVQDNRAIDIEESNINTGMATISNPAKLAPHEAYNPASTDYQAKTVVKRSGIPVSVAEMEQTRRSKERRQRRKQKSFGSLQQTSAGGERARTDQGLLRTLEKGNVAVIDGHGEHSLVSGKPKAGKEGLSGARIKL
ncbi:U3 small nucleolar RNA-associated protein [Drechslerella dactyloides]|uniref:U3 small nucleolar RNA-associated protein n=1 Tax=Drechslerella dactyloides TaxID=74499 RepID=A0AAD6J490_DREDA|nr:U3 small nucleolar RNA-associated protein [Drechslerella dactyloides]